MLVGFFAALEGDLLEEYATFLRNLRFIYKEARFGFFIDGCFLGAWCL